MAIVSGTASAKVAGYATTYANAARLCSAAAAGRVPASLASHATQLKSACRTFTDAVNAPNTAYTTRVQRRDYGKQDVAWKKAKLADHALNNTLMQELVPTDAALNSTFGAAVVTLNASLSDLGSLAYIDRNLLIALPALDQLACVLIALLPAQPSPAQPSLGRQRLPRTKRAAIRTPWLWESPHASDASVNSARPTRARGPGDSV